MPSTKQILSMEAQQRLSKYRYEEKRERRQRFGEYSIGMGEQVEREYGSDFRLVEAADLSELADEEKSIARLRALGWPLKSALGQARTMREAATLAERGALRLLFVQDSTCWNASDLFGDCIRPSEEKRLWKEVEETGVFGIVCETKDASGDWTCVDSVWGFFGEQDGTLFGNPYVADALAAGVNACAEAYAEQVAAFWSGEERC
jgi:hypothetical protein